MDEFVRSNVVHGRISGVEDCRATSAGVLTFKWFNWTFGGGTFCPFARINIKMSGGQQLQKGMFWDVRDFRCVCQSNTM